MEQHPIPQQISSYQFKLVGDMTLKQFFQVAGGVIVGLIFYSTPLHPLIKWPFILFFTLLGIALAFLPLEERPLEKWIVAFFRSIYSPTLYTWKKTEKPAVYYTETALAPAITTIASTGPVVQTDTAKLEEAEKSFLSKIGGLWNVSTSPVAVVTNPQPIATLQTNFVPTPPAVPEAPTTPPPVVTSPPFVNIPTQVPTVVQKSAPRFVIEETPQRQGGTSQTQVQKLDIPKVEEKPILSNVVEFSIDAAPPAPPIVINTVVGQVMDQDRKIVEGAILEIKDSSGRPVRALKSNRAGHFIIVTALANGKYEITTEKDGFKFEPVSFETKGEMIPPIAIKGTKI